MNETEIKESLRLTRRNFISQIGFGVFATQFLGKEAFAQGQTPPPIIKGKRLTKSSFVTATECPTRLFYIGKKEYANEMLENPFMKALGEGGFQVGELAKFYHPEGVEIKAVGLDKSIEETKAIFEKEKVTVFNAAIGTEQLLIRPNILIKNGNNIDLIEVKAKVFDSTKKEPFRTKKGKIRSGWREHLYDVAFQKYAIQKAYPQFKVSSYLMMADKSKSAPTDGLNQKFKIVKRRNGQKFAVASPKLTETDRKEEILTKINVDDLCDELFQETKTIRGVKMSFEKMVAVFATAYQREIKLRPQPASICRNCEFQQKSENSELKDGFRECWSQSLKWKKEDFDEPNVLKIWGYRRKDNLIQAGRIKQSQVLESDINPKADKKLGLSRTERQWLQIKKVKDSDPTPFIDKKNLVREMDSWTYPLHMIDFETSSPAIPFVKGMKPYEGIAFQYSHHIIHKNGKVEHKGEWLGSEPGEFPNFNFIRNLKKELENDEGSIFRYSNHENTYLNYIYRQLKASDEKDSNELCRFIKTITKSTGSSKEKWFGKRSMIDLWELVKRYYYDPYTKGSNSIKQVLPAILNSSTFLQEKYSEPIYGTSEISSFNFKDWTWLKRKNGKIVDPYKQLPKMFQDLSVRDVELLSFDKTLGDGGAALTAYGRLQFEEMSEYERKELKKALVKYCELDTFAMVMIYEGWKDMLTTT